MFIEPGNGRPTWANREALLPLILDNFYDKVDNRIFPGRARTDAAFLSNEDEIYVPNDKRPQKCKQIINMLCHYYLFSYTRCGK